MAKLVSSWSNGVQSIPKDYVMPLESRPGDFVSICYEIPVIDLQEDSKTDRSNIIQQILKASQELGVFQVINHGVTEKMMEDMRVLYDEFFNMSIDNKLRVYSENVGKGCSLYTSGMDYTKEDVHYWRDTLKHSCHPLKEHTSSWPEKPARYREDVGSYAIEVRKMGFRILDLIAEGLGLKEGYFNNGVSQEQLMAINHYPPCPNPSLAMGIKSHVDPSLITFLQQDQYGLQIHKDGKWMGIDPIPNAFVVNIGYQLEIISNGKLKSPEHRGVTNSTAARTSIVTFFGPIPDAPIVVEPAKELITSSNPQMFKSYQYNHFLVNYMAYLRKPLPRSGSPLDPYRL